MWKIIDRCLLRKIRFIQSSDCILRKQRNRMSCLFFISDLNLGHFWDLILKPIHKHPIYMLHYTMSRSESSETTNALCTRTLCVLSSQWQAQITIVRQCLARRNYYGQWQRARVTCLEQITTNVVLRSLHLG